MSRRDEMDGIEPRSVQGTIDGKGHRFLIIEAPYYEDVAAALIEGARAEFDAAGATGISTRGGPSRRGGR